MDVPELFRLLESNNPQAVEEVKKTFHEYFCATREAWLLNGLFDYYMSSGSSRVMEILIGVREPHERYLFDRLSESLRGASKLQGLTLLGYVVRRNPTWMYKITQHSLFKDLIKILKIETDILSVMSALMVLVVLLPMIAGFMAAQLQEVFEVFSRLASWNTNNQNKMSEGYLLHLQVGLYLLFQQLYGMYPCNFLAYLRQEYSIRGGNVAIFSHTIKPMLETVKMHHFLVTASKDAETAAARWKRMEPHDVIVECANFTIETSTSSVPVADSKPKDEVPPHEYHSSSRCPRSSLECAGVLDGSYTSRGVRAHSSLLQTNAEKDIWTPSTFCRGAASPLDASTSAPTSIPHTPISQTFAITSALPQQEGTSPPEAAVEATPETTPVKDLRQVSRVTPSVGSSVVRALNSTLGPAGGSCSPMHSQPSSPMKKEASPFRFPPDNCSAFQQLSRNVAATSNSVQSDSNQNRRDSVLSQRVQRIMLERIQVTDTHPQDGKTLKLKTPISNTTNAIQPTSPLRVISGTAWDQHQLGHMPAPNSPQLVNEMTQEDKEVENMMRESDPYAAGPPGTYGNRQCDSVLQEFHHLPHQMDDHEEVECYEECQQESGSPCTSGGLHMPNSQSMRDFARQVSRLRYYSYSYTQGREPALVLTSTASSLTEGSRFPEDTKVRRAVSCPEMKKSVSVSMLSPNDRPPLDENDEEEGIVDPIQSNGESDHTTPTVNGHALANPQESVSKRKRLISCSTQTENALPYEHLFLSVFPNIEQHHTPPPDASGSLSVANKDKAARFSPNQAVESFINTAVHGHDSRRTVQGIDGDLKVFKDQLVLLNLQLQFERHRREVHAERNRRLLGMSRNNRALEEHNSALRDQVSLLQHDKDSIQQELDHRRRETNYSMQKLQESLDYWQEQSKGHQKACEDARTCCETLQHELKEEREKTATVTKNLNDTQAQLFDTTSELQHALSVLSANREVREELRNSQKEVVMGGELQQKSRDTLSHLAKTVHQASQLSLQHDAYTLQIDAISGQHDRKNSDFESLQLRISELETIILEKDRLLNNRNKLIEKAQSDHNEKLKVAERKHQAVSSTHSNLEERIIVLNNQLDTIILAKEKQPASPKSTKSTLAMPVSHQTNKLHLPLSQSSVVQTPLRNLHVLTEDSEQKISGTSGVSSPENIH